MINVTTLDSMSTGHPQGEVVRRRSSSPDFARLLTKADLSSERRRQDDGRAPSRTDKDKGGCEWTQTRAGKAEVTKRREQSQTSKAASNQREDNDQPCDETLPDMVFVPLPEELAFLHAEWVSGPLAGSPDEMIELVSFFEAQLEKTEDPTRMTSLSKQWGDMILAGDQLPAEPKTFIENLSNQFREGQSADAYPVLADASTNLQDGMPKEDISNDVLFKGFFELMAGASTANGNNGESKAIQGQTAEAVQFSFSDNREENQDKKMMLPMRPDESLPHPAEQQQGATADTSQPHSNPQSVSLMDLPGQTGKQLRQAVFHQVMQNIQVIITNKENLVTMRLVPEHLGKLTVQLTADAQQMMTARIFVENPQAKELIESNSGQLRDALSGKGVNLTAMEVYVGQDPESSEKQREFLYQQALAKRRHMHQFKDLIRGVEQAGLQDAAIRSNPYLQKGGFDQKV